MRRFPSVLQIPYSCGLSGTLGWNLIFLAIPRQAKQTSQFVCMAHLCRIKVEARRFWVNVNLCSRVLVYETRPGHVCIGFHESVSDV